MTKVHFIDLFSSEYNDEDKIEKALHQKIQGFS